MGIYRVFAGSDGESHMEELCLEEHPELGALTNILTLLMRHVSERSWTVPANAS